MRKIEIEEMRQLQLSILEAFHTFCKEQRLTYCMCGGTLLGAVRHKGYIPWDDDIDVMMPREDYMHFLKLAKELGFPYKVISPYEVEADSRHPYTGTYVKLADASTLLIERPQTHGIRTHVYVDVFPIDGLPDSYEESLKLYKRAKKWIWLYALQKAAPYRMKKDRQLWKRLLWHCIYLFFQCVPRDFTFRKLDNFAQRYSFKEAQYVGDIVAGYGIKERVSRHIFDDVIELTFEGRKYCAPVGYKEYLTALYGDYMQLPPKEKQVLAHDNEAYDIEDGR